MGCFSGIIGEDDGLDQDSNLRTLRSILATKQGPWPSPCPAKKTIQRTLAFFLSRRTTRARARLLDKASQSLARAKVQIISKASSPQSEHMISTNYTVNDSANHSESSEHQPVLYYPLPLPNSASHLNTNLSINSNSNPTIPSSANYHINSASSLFYCVFSASYDSSNSLSSSFSNSSSSAISNYSTSKGNLRCSSMSHIDHHSFAAPCPLPPLPSSMAATVALLREFLPHELSEACANFSEAKKLRDAAMGPVYQGTIKALGSSINSNGDQQETVIAVQIARVATNLNRRRWKAQIQWLARQTHPNLCRILGFSYERARSKSRDQSNDNRTAVSTNYDSNHNSTTGTHTGFVVYAGAGHSDQNNGHGSLDKLLQQGAVNHGVQQASIDWHTRLKIATGAAEGLAFLLERIPPTQIIYNSFEASNVQLDSSYNAKLIDFTFTSLGKNESLEACAFDMQGFGILLLQLFGFIKYPYHRDLVNYDFSHIISRVSPMKDAKLIIDLAIRCLMPNSSLQPSMVEVVQLLRDAEHTSKRKRRSSSFG